MNTDVPVALTIAGSDSGGGAGIQADLKVFADMGVFGASAVTCVTAQNPAGVHAVAALDAPMISRQIEAVLDAFPVAAAKTGMLHSTAVIEAVAASLRRRPIPRLVVDPVMAATSGARLLRDDALAALRSRLLPLAAVITPNVPEAEALDGGRRLRSVDDLRGAARRIGEEFGAACVVKGGHLIGSEAADVLFCEGRLTTLARPRIEGAETHGTGCVFSAAIAACLARGDAVPRAVEKAKAFVAAAIECRVRTGAHHPLGWGPGVRAAMEG